MLVVLFPVCFACSDPQFLGEMQSSWQSCSAAPCSGVSGRGYPGRTEGLLCISVFLSRALRVKHIRPEGKLCVGSYCTYCGNYCSKAEVAESAHIPFGSKSPLCEEGNVAHSRAHPQRGRVGSKVWELLKGGLSPITVGSQLLAQWRANSAPLHMDENFWKLFYPLTLH